MTNCRAYDGIFRLKGSRLEFGAIEAGREWEGEHGRKYIRDSLKLRKILHDMLIQLSTECDANQLQLLTMDSPMGYVSRIQHHEFREITGYINKPLLGFVLKDILRARSTITQALELIQESRSNINNLDDSDSPSQTKQHADSNLPKDRLPLYNNFFPELVQIQTYLEDFSLCEKHYNQLIVSDFFNDFDNEFGERQTRTQYTCDENTCEIGVQASAQTNEVGVQVNKETHEVGIQTFDTMLHILENHVCLFQLELDSKINEINDLNKQLEYVYDYVVETIIDSLLNSINLSDRPNYRGLQQKSCSQLQEILQSIRDLHKNQDDLENEIDLHKNHDDLENEIELEN
ncbi:8126_t:CDS:2 [Racocetra fulgida]|uniref:8126_t:CDS:1 n=1 Tax=Racocetra fulgida TaxID=60492 RepID=A0A9N8W256_9GLOM|nr:8126_t:CDS:2 [Racocetra fulgida]